MFSRHTDYLEMTVHLSFSQCLLVFLFFLPRVEAIVTICYIRYISMIDRAKQMIHVSCAYALVTPCFSLVIEWISSSVKWTISDVAGINIQGI